MLDVYKFLEEKKKQTLPPGIVDLSSAPRVSMPAPPQKPSSFVPGTVPMPYTPALDKVRQPASVPPVATDMWQTSHPSQQVIPEQQRVVEQLKTIAKPPAVDMVTGAAPSVKPPDVSGADLARSREQDRARAIMSGTPAVKPVDYSQPTVKLPSPDTQETAAQKAGGLGLRIRASLTGRTPEQVESDDTERLKRLQEEERKEAKERKDRIAKQYPEGHPVHKFWESGVGQYIQRVGEIGGQAAAPGKSTYEELPSTGNAAVDFTADIIGTIMGFTVPGGVGRMGYEIVSPVSHAAMGRLLTTKAGERVLKTMASQKVIQELGPVPSPIKDMIGRVAARAVIGGLTSGITFSGRSLLMDALNLEGVPDAKKAQEIAENMAKDFGWGFMTGAILGGGRAIIKEAKPYMTSTSMVRQGYREIKDPATKKGLGIYWKEVKPKAGQPSVEFVVTKPTEATLQTRLDYLNKYAQTEWAQTSRGKEMVARIQNTVDAYEIGKTGAYTVFPEKARMPVPAEQAARQLKALERIAALRAKPDIKPQPVRTGLFGERIDLTPTPSPLVQASRARSAEFAKTAAPMRGAEQVVYSKILEQGGTRQEAQQIVEQINDVFAKHGLEFNIGNVVKHFGDVLGVTYSGATGKAWKPTAKADKAEEPVIPPAEATVTPQTPEEIRRAMQEFQLAQQAERERRAAEEELEAKRQEKEKAKKIREMEKRIAELMGGKPTAKAPAAPTAETETTPTTEAETTPDAERRTNLALRTEINKLSPEEKDEAIKDLRARVFTDELTGLKNRAAYMMDEKQPVQAIIDLDNLKWVNDNIGHGAGDALIKTLAGALPENSYRISGDEFIVQGQSKEELESLLSGLEARLNEQVLELAGDKQTVSKKGIGFSYGIGETLDKAETALQEHKKARLAEGKRVERGEVPPGIDISKREEDTIQTIKPNSVVRSTAGSTAGKLYTVLEIDGNKATVKSHDTGQNYRLNVSTLELVEDSAAGTGPEPETKPAEKEPWEMTREEFISGVPKGFKYIADLGETIARYNSDGTITLTDAFFGHNEQTKKELLAHEKAHGIVKDVYANNENFWDLVNSGLFGKYDSDAMKFKGVPYALRNVDEILTQLVADLQIGVPKKFRDKYAVQYNIAQQILDGKEVDIRQAIQQALSEGKPVPPEVLKDYPELRPAEKPTPAKATSPAEVEPETSAAATEEIPRVFYVKVGTQDVEVIKNPTDSEYQQLSKEFRKEYPRAPKDEIQIRTTYDEKGNKYIWRADNATHDAIEKHLQTVYGVKASQNAPVIESETESTEVEPEAVKEETPKPINKAQQAKRDKILNTRVNYTGYGVMTRKKFIEDRLAEGFKVEAKEVADPNATKKAEAELKRIKDTYIPGLSNPNSPKAKRYDELKEMLDKGITKTEYRIPTSGTEHYVITKTEYDYAKSIEGKTAAEIVPTGKTEKIDAYTARMGRSPETGREREIRTEYRVVKLTDKNREGLYKGFKERYGNEYVVEERTTKDGDSSEWNIMAFHKDQKSAVAYIAGLPRINPVSDVVKKAVEAEKKAEEAAKKKAEEEKKAEAERIERYNNLVKSVAKEYPLSKLKRANITIVGTKGELSPPFSAYKISDSLFIHKEIDGKTRKPSRKKDAPWMVTAHPAGVSLDKYKTPEEAIAMAVAFDRSGIEIGKTVDAVKDQTDRILKIRKDFLMGVMPEKKQDKGVGQAGEKTTAGTGKAEKKLDQVMTELGEEVDRVVGDTNIPIGQTVRIVGGSPAAAGTFSSADPEIDARVKASHGVKSPSTFSKIKELMGSLARMASREYEHLPRGKEFAPVRFELLRLAKQKDVATTKTLKTIQGILVDFINDPKAYNHFEWKVLLNDLAEEAKAGHELPFGYTEEKLKADIKRLDEALKDYPQVTRAVEKRRKVWDAIVDAYIEAQEAIGFKVEGKLTKQDYYRHMVLDYANQRRTPSGTGKKLRTPTGAFYLKHRKGSTLDINTNYLEAEYEVMARMLYDIERSKVIKFVDNEANIINKLKGKAKSTNHSNIMKHFEQMAKRMNEGEDPDKWVTAEDMYRRTLNKKQAMGFNRLAEMAEDGELPGDNDPKWIKTIDALARGEENEKTMEYLSWILKNHHDTEAARNAALIFRGIHEKDRYIRETLGNKFVTWEDIIPEGYTTWQPREGNVFFFADTISSQYAEEQLAKGMEVIGVPKNKIRQVLAVGRKFPEMVVREEIAMTLDNLTVDRPLNPVSDFFKRIMGAWKEYQLISPKRWAKHNIRNVSGDAEPAYIGNPSTFTKVPRAAKELYHVYFGDGAMTKDMRDWFERGGMQSLLTVQEMGDVNQLRMFVDLMEKKGKITEIPTRIWQGYWKAARLSTNYREAILRYAAYLDYREQIKAGKGKPKNFGASDPEEVMALKSDEDKAYWLSNDLLGAYDRVSVVGKWLREYLMPFWSFQEVNFKRYIQFIKNAARDEKTAEMVGCIGLSLAKTTIKRSPFLAYRIGKFLIKAAGVWVALDTYNKMRWPDEEKELPPDVRNTPHIVLGRDKNGEVLYFTRLGSLGDFLEWFGLEESPALVGDFLNGRKNLKEIVTEMAKGSANKVIQAVGPQYKTPAELIMGRKVFPDAFDPGMIRDRWYYVFQSLDLDEEYSAIMKLPRKPYMETLKNFLVYSQEPGQGAYYEIRDLNREFQKKVLGKTAGGWYSDEISAKSRALYNLKLAIRYQDAEAMKRYAAEYISHGGTADGLKTSLRNMHPLHGLNKTEEKAFIAWLDEEDRERLILAMEYYTNVLKGERNKPKEEKQQEGGK